MILGIDASNIKSGGGQTHLIEIINSVIPTHYDIDKIFVWSCRSTLSKLPEHEWIYKINNSFLEGNLIKQEYWRRNLLDLEVRKNNCNLLFVPGGMYTGLFRPYVTMCRNMLPFEWVEIRRFGLSFFLLKLILLRTMLIKSFKEANGLIFLSKYAYESVTNIIKSIKGSIKIIPHGIDQRFRVPPRIQRDVKLCSKNNPFKILYVSSVNPYKHQWHVVESVIHLIKKGYPLRLDLIGSATQTSLNKLNKSIGLSIDAEKSINYHGPIQYKDIHQWYANADLFVYASSCENLPNILIEAMASGLPIACSKRGPMPEIIGDAGVYFDPENPKEISDAIQKMIVDPVFRLDLANKCFEKSQKYSWRNCAHETFKFLSDINKRK